MGTNLSGAGIVANSNVLSATGPSLQGLLMNAVTTSPASNGSSIHPSRGWIVTYLQVRFPGEWSPTRQLHTGKQRPRKQEPRTGRQHQEP
jgi:hypothetical protein